MYGKVTKTVAGANHSSAMGAETISKNRISPKNERIRIMLYLLLFLTTSILFSACQEVSIEELTVQTSTNSNYFYAEGGTHDVIITCNISVSATEYPDWITVTKTGDKGEQIFHLTALANESISARSGSVLFKAAQSSSGVSQSVSVNISVMQGGISNNDEELTGTTWFYSETEKDYYLSSTLAFESNGKGTIALYEHITGLPYHDPNIIPFSYTYEAPTVVITFKDEDVVHYKLKINPGSSKINGNKLVFAPGFWGGIETYTRK